jgi:hypothetical protein
LEPFSFLQSRRSAKLKICETEFYEAAVGDLTLPAMTGQWQADLIQSGRQQLILAKTTPQFCLGRCVPIINNNPDVLRLNNVRFR